MATPIQRRHTPVPHARQLISAIVYIRQQRQIPNFERISRHMQRCFEVTPRNCKEYLNDAVNDGLIVEYSAVVGRGQRTGSEQEGYRIPQAGEVEQVDDGHDWYCFECHGPGEVYECSGCFRVYHQGCTREDTTGQHFTCSVCRGSRKKNKMKKQMLNTLLSYTILHLREKTRELHKLALRASAEDFKRYIYKKMDLNRMELKVQASRYKCLEEFHADARTILHNCTLIFGEEKGGMTDLAAVMVRDCKYDLDEIELCPNCYYMSNAKPEDWFSQPCNPPHDLVYAKQKGYSYWPAKVVQDLGGKSDVRFFGGWHQRAVIPAEYIKPITTDLKSMTIKKTAGFVKAMKELKRHEMILEEREKEKEANGSQEWEEEGAEEEEEIEGEDQGQEDGEDEEHVDEAKNDNATEEEVDEEMYAEEDEEQKSEDTLKVRTPKKTANRRRNSSQNKSSSKKAQKRPRKEMEDDDVYDRQVTSTSVERSSKKQKKKATKSLEESYTVSSSGDPKSVSVPVVTSCAAVQTIAVKRESVSVQTDIKEEKVETFEGTSKDGEILEGEEKTKVIEEKPKTQQAMDDQLWEERMTSAMAQLSKRLEEKFEEDKNAALLEQSRQLEEDFGKDKQQAVERTIASMKQEVEKAKKSAEDRAREQYMEEMKKLAAKHKEAISLTKKKQWCQNCEHEAMYHCCWNTAYCSVICQQAHWHSDHKRVCRRKRTQEDKS